MSTPDDVAALVHAQYDRLPKTGKPQPGEWTVLAGVVLSRSGCNGVVVALGTGTKCLTASQIAADVAGECLHDGHAETCARRAFRAYLMSEMRLAACGADSEAITPRGSGSAINAASNFITKAWLARSICAALGSSRGGAAESSALIAVCESDR